MSHSPAAQGMSPFKRRVVAALSAVVLGGGLSLGLTLGSSSEDKSIEQNCIYSTCTVIPPDKKEPTKEPTPKPAPQLMPTKVVGVPAQIRRSGPATVYGAPSTKAGVKYELEPGQRVTISCQMWAEVVESPRDQKPSALWNKIGDDEWVPDAYTDTNSDGPVTRFCDGP